MIAVTLLRVPSVGSVNLIEFIWTLTGLVTVVFCAIQLRRAYARKVELAKSGRNGPMKILANGYIRRESLRILSGLCILGIGIYADTLEAPFGDYITWSGIAVTVTLFMIGLVEILQSIFDRRQAHRVSDAILDELNHNHE